MFGTDQTPPNGLYQLKHLKSTKNGNKTQVEGKSYLLELSKTRKSMVHALSSLRRTTSLLAPSTVDGRIRRIFREKFLSKAFLSKMVAAGKILVLHDFLVFKNWGRQLFEILSSSDLKTLPKMTVISLISQI